MSEFDSTVNSAAFSLPSINESTVILPEGGASPRLDKEEKKKNGGAKNSRSNFMLKVWIELSDFHRDQTLMLNILKDWTLYAFLNQVLQKYRAASRRQNVQVPAVRPNECSLRWVGQPEDAFPVPLPLKMTGSVTEQLLNLRVPYTDKFQVAVILDPEILRQKMENELMEKIKRLEKKEAKQRWREQQLFGRNLLILEMTMRESLQRARWVFSERIYRVLILDHAKREFDEELRRLIHQHQQEERDALSDRNFFDRLRLRQFMMWNLQIVQKYKQLQDVHKSLRGIMKLALSVKFRLMVTENNIWQRYLIEHRHCDHSQLVRWDEEDEWANITAAAEEDIARIVLLTEEKRQFQKFLDMAAHEVAVIKDAKQREKREHLDAKHKMYLQRVADRLNGTIMKRTTQREEKQTHLNKLDPTLRIQAQIRDLKMRQIEEAQAWRDDLLMQSRFRAPSHLDSALIQPQSLPSLHSPSGGAHAHTHPYAATSNAPYEHTQYSNHHLSHAMTPTNTHNNTFNPYHNASPPALRSNEPPLSPSGIGLVFSNAPSPVAAIKSTASRLSPSQRRQQEREAEAAANASKGFWQHQPTALTPPSTLPLHSLHGKLPNLPAATASPFVAAHAHKKSR
eukprot:TRINITY_DN14279_c0_g1_i1.p1 TRINITY_DN14279_c0_g1~~TRINITY_DN14279_c0_g1_i1.p1  ORF type:complete len:624 (+),score=29.42 TRINITY_DN14279_c0_g1_i1:35-1906(+)